MCIANGTDLGLEAGDLLEDRDPRGVHDVAQDKARVMRDRRHLGALTLRTTVGGLEGKGKIAAKGGRQVKWSGVGGHWATVSSSRQCDGLE